MSNKVPTSPPIATSCSTSTPEEAGYFTELQSHTNVARSDSFKLVLDVPCGIKPMLLKENRYCHGGSLDKLEFSVWGYNVPEISVPSLEQTYAGQTFKFSSNSRPAYSPINLNFTVDNKFDNYFILWKWLEIMNNSYTSYGDSMPDYMVKISIYALDEYKNPVVEWIHHDAFITTIGSLDTSSRGAKELETSFTFEFSRLEMKLL